MGACCTLAAGKVSPDQGLERVALLALDVEHEVVGALLGHPARQLGDDRAVDQGDRDEQGQTGAQREHDGAGQPAGRAQIADGERQLGLARTRHAPGEPRSVPIPEPRKTANTPTTPRQ